MTDYDKIEQVKQIITEVLYKCGVQSTVEFGESIVQGLIFNVSSPDSYLIIGRQGAMFHSLEILVPALVAGKFKYEQLLWFALDVDDYKRKREWYLKETAKGAVGHMKRTGRSVALEPMPNYERRLIHVYLQEHNPKCSPKALARNHTGK